MGAKSTKVSLKLPSSHRYAPSRQSVARDATSDPLEAAATINGTPQHDRRRTRF